MRIILFHVAVFFSAFLLFQVELIASKAMLPGFGGSYLVWSVSVMLFQGLLLAGYWYADIAGKWFRGGRRKFFKPAMMLLPVLLFPVELSGLTTRDLSMPFVWEIMLTLLRTVGFGFFALSSVAVVLQRALADSDLEQRRNPYVLYATSNMGSFAGLLSYPFLVEPVFELSTQLFIWQCGYALVASLFILIHATVKDTSGAPAGAAAEKTKPRLPIAERLRWLTLSAGGSALFLAVSNVITFDLASAPLIWILPLCAYLLTFVLTFKNTPWYPAWLRERFAFASAIGVFLFFLMIQSYKLPLAVTLPMHLLILMAICTVCHGELKKSAPKNPGLLAEFYIMLSLGGFVGGVLVSWLSPLVSDSIMEYLLALFLAALGLAMGAKEKWRGKSVLLALMLIPLIVGWRISVTDTSPAVSTIISTIAGFFLALLFFALKSRPREIALMLGLTLMLAQSLDHVQPNRELKLKHRNYYGIYRVFDKDGIRYLMHGTTLHGSQYLAPEKQDIAMTYYHKSTPAGELLSADIFDIPKIGVVGLGAGSLAVYGKPAQEMDIFELDPYNKDVAETWFTFLKQCKAHLNLIFGDARLRLREKPDNHYTVYIIDAFNSDSIPVHLFTVEAMNEYRRKVSPGGLLLFHISNKYLDLRPILAANARELGMIALVKNVVNTPKDAKPCIWGALTTNAKAAEVLVKGFGWSYAEEMNLPVVRPWTDQYSNLLTAFPVAQGW